MGINFGSTFSSNSEFLDRLLQTGREKVKVAIGGNYLAETTVGLLPFFISAARDGQTMEESAILFLSSLRQSGAKEHESSPLRLSAIVAARAIALATLLEPFLFSLGYRPADEL